MKRTRISLAALAIVVLIVAAAMPGSAVPYAMLATRPLVLPLTLTLMRQWDVVVSTRSKSLERSLVLLRAPPATSKR